MSVYRSSKRPPHIVFLVDTLPFIHLECKTDEETFASIQAIILRILLYYVDNVDDRITWGFRFFNTNSTSITMSNRRFHPVSTQSIQEFVKELGTKVHHDRFKTAADKDMMATVKVDPTNNNNDSCFSNLKQTLMQTLAEFQWKDIDLLGASPRSQRIRNSAKGSTSSHHVRRDQPVVLNNYMYVISHRPHTLSDLRHYIEGHHTKKSIQTKLTPQGDIMDAFHSIQQMADELKRWLWDDYANHQISINWIDRESWTTQKEIDRFIQQGFESIMEMFGGHLIQEPMLQYDYDYFGLSFATVFDHYRCRHMDAPPQLKLSMTHLQQQKKLTNVPENISKLDTPVWSGPLISNLEKLEQCQIHAYRMNRQKLNHKTQPDQATTEELEKPTVFDGMESLKIISLLYTEELRQGKWIQFLDDTSYALWSPNVEFSTIIKLLQDQLMVLLVKLCPLDASRLDTSVAIVEPILDGCASVTPLLFDGDTFLSNPGDQKDGLPLEDDVFPWNPPLGSNIIGYSKLGTQKSILQDLDNDHATEFKLDMETLPCVDILSNAFSRSVIDDVRPSLNTLVSKQTKSKGTIASTNTMPNNIDEFTQTLQDLYLDTLYSSKYTLLESMTLLLSYVDHALDSKHQGNMDGSLVVASLQSLIMLSSEFDQKHRTRIPAMVNSGIGDGNEQEHICLSSWLRHIRTKYGDDMEKEELSFKALKIRDAKLQIILLLTIIRVQQEQQRNSSQKQKSTSRKKKRSDGRANTTDLASENPEEQVEIYFDRMFIWEQVSSVVGFLQERDAEAFEKSKKRLDQADIFIHHFCGHLDKCFSKKLPDLIKKLWAKIDKDDSDDMDDTIPIANKRRKTLLKMRMRGDIAGETVTADWISSPPISDSQNSQRQQEQQEDLEYKAVHQMESPSSGASKRKETMFPILPFMKREIIMSKTINANKGKQQSTMDADKTGNVDKSSETSSKPMIRRTGSFTKSAISPKRSAKRKPTTETNTVVLRKRQVHSPTTPRTRLAREFGISLTPQLMTETNNNAIQLSPESTSTSLSTELDAMTNRPRTNRELGIAVSPARSAARKIIGVKSPRIHRNKRRDQHGVDKSTTITVPRNLTTALLAARSPSNDQHRTKPNISKAFSSLFDE
ncbi:uncharacterized protein BX664DRAFT_362469 [Halteromyces radiatus]|uniref:uncharacterized protein n=1 Tax=Halteromyces radiatus TaxID=101107 RepID=UPI002220CE9A|nr:uncharacterized protein BX664DRAFT_362469 [Halteromyces radiatus]KAI8077673.1 hypothetical protein BX664DRAFT_362469 [Halteromyces radiatus]